MPNGVKYSTTTPTGALRKSNVALGVNGNLGPTANTGFYSMPTPASGKYIINKVAASGVPLFFAPQNDTELIQFARNEGATGANTGSAAAVLSWIATQANLEAANFEYENIVTDGLVLNVDAGFVGSYPTINTTWYDLSGNTNNGTLVNGPTFSSANSGSIVFDGVDDYCGITNDLSTRQNWNSYWANSNQVTFIMVISANFSGTTTQRDSLFGQQYYYGNGFSIEIHGNGTQPRNLGYNIGANANFATLSGPTYSNFTYQPTFISLTHDGTTKQIRFSINGTFYSATLPQVVSVGNFMNDNTFNVQVARFDRGEGFYNKSFYYLSTYNRVLSDSEVLQNFNALRGRFGL
jgi:hypothetical protein